MPSAPRYEQPHGMTSTQRLNPRSVAAAAPDRRYRLRLTRPQPIARPDPVNSAQCVISRAGPHHSPLGNALSNNRGKNKTNSSKFINGDNTPRLEHTRSVQPKPHQMHNNLKRSFATCLCSNAREINHPLAF